ncbi:delta-lactam-biosynthetic de-N-acetylase [Candidatus Clostridium radicumherbarum]|uniref:Delta-lactam-biosynthetic de-N-acetylase n=1 Tax=Candidatus Clostridium radicumherbarum TaxID=3381662 RepID=A0ABW8TXL1_9CLOT
MLKKAICLSLAFPLSLNIFPINNNIKDIFSKANENKAYKLESFKENLQVDDLDKNSMNNHMNKNLNSYFEKRVVVDDLKLNTTERNWFFQPKKDGSPSGEPPDVLELLKKYSGYYLGDTSKKIIYLTFDEGYENGYSAKILDSLKANDVKAAFFVTTDYIKRNQDLIKRMTTEGHLVCNHSTTHPSMAQSAIKDKAKFEKEFTICEMAFEEVTGTKMPKFFRPPMGKYSELSLYYTQALGYKSIFWSFAYKDWLPDNQPSIEAARKIIMERTHNGGIFLLHAVSKTNATIMDSILKEWKAKGFEFKTLNELP